MTAERRPKGEGSIGERADGKWIATTELPRGLDGKRRRKVREFDSQKAAYVGLRVLQKEVAGGDASNPRITLNEIIEKYLSEGVNPSAREVTIAGYEYVLRHYVGEVMGKRRFSDVNEALVLKWRAHLRASGMSTRTIRLSNQQFNALYRWAARHTYASTNPVESAGPVTGPKGRRGNGLEHEQARAYLSAAAGDELETLVIVALGLGLRRSETAALRWSVIDLERATLHVSRGVVEFSRNGRTVVVEDEPKTESSDRHLPLPPFVVDALRRRKDSQMASRAALGLKWSESTYVFANDDGTLPLPSTLTHRFAAFKKRHSLPSVPLKDLRHSTAHLMLSALIPLESVSQVLGHSSVAITKDVYGGVVRELTERAMADYADYLGSSRLDKES